MKYKKIKKIKREIKLFRNFKCTKYKNGEQIRQRVEKKYCHRVSAHLQFIINNNNNNNRKGAFLYINLNHAKSL
jgi:hypothetical protein